MATVRQWDARLDARGVRVHTIATTPGQPYWQVIRGRWFDVAESGGRHHIYVETLDEAGQPLPNVPFRVAWPSGNTTALTNGYSGFDSGNVPLSPSRNEFEVAVADGQPSERVSGIGMGAETPGGFNAGAHTSTLIVFQRTRFAGEPEPPPVDPPDNPPTADPILDALYDARSAIDAAIRRYLERL